MVSHFLADLHLQPDRPQLTQMFLRYAAGPARQANRIYILGDLFEYWIGDDGSMPDYPLVINALADLSKAGIEVFFMRGNRDFMVAQDFSATTGVRILEDPEVIRLGATAVLLSHGDRFCTADASHQRFRALFNDPDWRARMRAYPVWIRRLIARYARARSRFGQRRKAREIMDVTPSAVRQTMQHYHCRELIHGHTHRPADHDLEISDGLACRRVLMDWDEVRGGEILVHDHGGFRRQPVVTA